MTAQFLRFCIVGGTSAVVSIALLWLLHEVAHLQYLLAFAITFVVVNVLAYLASRRFTFSTTTVGAASGLARYFAVTGLGLVINSGAMVVFVEWLGLWPVAAAAWLCVLNAPLNYLMHRHLTFGLARQP